MTSRPAAPRAITGAAIACVLALAWLSGPRAAAASRVARPATAQAPATAVPAGRYNVSAPHSPRLQRMLAGGQAIRPALAGHRTLAAAVAAQPQGVDVASFQHANGQAIGWQKVAAAGYRFAFVKATEGSYYANPYYAGDVAAARAAGLFAAGYHFAIPNYSGGTLQADFALNDAATAPDGLTLPFILDIEYDPYVSLDHTNMCYGLSPAAMVAWIRAFSAEVARRAGEPPVIYTTQDWWNACTGNSAAFAAGPLWVAAYSTSSPPLPAGWANWTYWQYSSGGTVPGIAGSVDVSYFDTAYLTVAPPGDQSDPEGAPATLQVHALNAAAGEALTYTAAGLPPGLAIDPATGLVSGTLPQAPGSHPVTVTVAAPGGTTRTLRFTWRIHGPARLIGPGRQVAAAGDPVDLQVSSPDGVAGCSLAFSATGLPPGLAISPCGRITGWAGRPGRYAVTVRATDSTRRVAGQMTFPWNVGPPPGGVTGRVRLAVGRLCLADPPARHVIGIWTCRRSKGQIWDVVQNGTLRLNGRCLAVAKPPAGGTTLALHACDRAADQQWQLGAGGALVNALAGQCLTDPGSSPRAGTAVTMTACSGAAGQAWTLPPGPLATGLHDRCLAGIPAKSGHPARVSLTACASPARAGRAGQAWTLAPDGAITVLHVPGRCLAISASAEAGAAVGWSACRRGATAQRWQPMPGAGGTFLVNPASGLCLTTLARVPAGRPATALGYCQAAYPRLTWRVS